MLVEQPKHTGNEVYNPQAQFMHTLTIPSIDTVSFIDKRPIMSEVWVELVKDSACLKKKS